jgi:hypothetical protein
MRPTGAARAAAWPDAGAPGRPDAAKERRRWHAATCAAAGRGRHAVHRPCRAGRARPHGDHPAGRFDRARWTIEQGFRTLNRQGFASEARRIADTEPCQTLAAARLAASRGMQRVQARDRAAGLPLRHAVMPDHQPALEALSDQLAGNTAPQNTPHPNGSLAFAASVCARLGGCTGSDGKPAPIVLYNQLRQCHASQRRFALRRILSIT